MDAKARDLSRRIQELEETVGSLNDLVINQAHDIRNLERHVAEIHPNVVWESRSKGIPAKNY